MLKIRLQRVGRKNQPAFRMVVTEHSAAPQGRFIEKLGNFSAANKQDTLQITTDRVQYWLSVGAQPSDTVARLLVKNGVKEAAKFIKARVQKPSNAELEAKKKAEEEAAAKIAAAAQAAADAEAAKLAKAAEAEAAAQAAEAPAEVVADEAPSSEEEPQA